MTRMRTCRHEGVATRHREGNGFVGRAPVLGDDEGAIGGVVRRELTSPVCRRGPRPCLQGQSYRPSQHSNLIHIMSADGEVCRAHRYARGSCG